MTKEFPITIFIILLLYFFVVIKEFEIFNYTKDIIENIEEKNKKIEMMIDEL